MLALEWMCKIVSKNINFLGQSQAGSLFIIESGIKRVGAISPFCLEDSRISTSQNNTRWPWSIYQKTLAVRYFRHYQRVCCKKLSQKTVDIIQPRIHLNRVSPLRQVYNFYQDHVDPWKAAELAQSAYKLSNSSDPEIVAYFQQQKRFKDLALWRKKEALKLGHLIQNQTYYIAFKGRNRSNRAF